MNHLSIADWESHQKAAGMQMVKDEAFKEMGPAHRDEDAPRRLKSSWFMQDLEAE